MKNHLKSQKPLCQISKLKWDTNTTAISLPNKMTVHIKQFDNKQLILNPEWKEKGEATCNSTIIITENNINECDFCTYQNNEDNWSQTAFYRGTSEDSLRARFRQHAACRVLNSLSHFGMAIISFDENRIKHEVTEVLLRCYRFSGVLFKYWHSLMKHYMKNWACLYIEHICSSYNVFRFLSQNRSVYWC